MEVSRQGGILSGMTLSPCPAVISILLFLPSLLAAAEKPKKDLEEFGRRYAAQDAPLFDYLLYNDFLGSARVMEGPPAHLAFQNDLPDGRPAVFIYSPGRSDAEPPVPEGLFVVRNDGSGRLKLSPVETGGLETLPSSGLMARAAGSLVEPDPLKVVETSEAQQRALEDYASWKDEVRLRGASARLAALWRLDAASLGGALDSAEREGGLLDSLAGPASGGRLTEAVGNALGGGVGAGRGRAARVPGLARPGESEAAHGTAVGGGRRVPAGPLAHVYVGDGRYLLSSDGKVRDDSGKVVGVHLALDGQRRMLLAREDGYYEDGIKVGYPVHEGVGFYHGRHVPRANGDPPTPHWRGDWKVLLTESPEGPKAVDYGELNIQGARTMPVERHDGYRWRPRQAYLIPTGRWVGNRFFPDGRYLDPQGTGYDYRFVEDGEDRRWVVRPFRVSSPL